MHSLEVVVFLKLVHTEYKYEELVATLTFVIFVICICLLFYFKINVRKK